MTFPDEIGAGRARLVFCFRVAAAPLALRGPAMARLEPEELTRPPEEGARLVALRFLEDAATALARVAAGERPDALHEFRVNLRRLRSTLQAFEPHLESAPDRAGAGALARARLALERRARRRGADRLARRRGAASSRGATAPRCAG